MYLGLKLVVKKKKVKNMAIRNIRSFENNNNTKRNTLIGAGVAGLGSAYASHILTNPIKNKKFDDKFVHNVLKNWTTDIESAKYFDFASTVNNMGAHPQAKDVKFVEDYMMNNAKSLGLLELYSPKTSKPKTIYQHIEDIQTGYRETMAEIEDSLKSVYDISKKSFKKLAEDADEDLKVFAEIAKETLGDIKVKKALKYGGIGTLAGGAIAWVATKLSNKQ